MTGDSSVGTVTRLRARRSGVRIRRSQWPSGLRRGSAADRLLGLQLRIPPGAWMLVLCVLYSKDKEVRTKVQREQKKKSQQGARVYSLFHIDRTGCDALPTSYSVGEVDLSPLSIAEVNIRVFVLSSSLSSSSVALQLFVSPGFP